MIIGEGATFLEEQCTCFRYKSYMELVLYSCTFLTQMLVNSKIIKVVCAYMRLYIQELLSDAWLSAYLLVHVRAWLVSGDSCDS